VPNATNYAVYVFDVTTSTAAYTWVANASECASGVCSTTPTTALINGDTYGWFVSAYINAWGAWSAGLGVLVSVAPTTAPTQIGPVGQYTRGITPTYTWTPLYSALNYVIAVWDVSQNPFVQVLVQAFDKSVCTTSTCSVTPTTPLTNGHSYGWFVAAGNFGGYGPWSPGQTFTPTIGPGVCEVLVAHQPTIDSYYTAQAAAIAIRDSQHGFAGTFGFNLTLEVYARSNLYSNLVKVGNPAIPTQGWIDSGGGAVVPANGTNCAGLLPEQTSVSNPQTTPTYTNYPLHPVSVPNPSSAELYQFAISNSLYGLTTNRHPGTDFFRGPAANSPSLNDRVSAVADGTVVGFYDPASTPNLQVGQSNWIANASPTDKPDRAYVVIRHGNTVVLYAHLQPGLRIGGPGDPVVAGQWIGSIGLNPVEGPHLHFEVRTYGEQNFDITQPPLIFINGWQYFNSTLQGIVDQNIVNRNGDDQNTAPGWNGANPASSGLQRTQCFRSPANAPPGAPTTAGGIIVYGYDSSGNANYSAFEWIGMSTPFSVTLSGTWQSVCKP
jgi:murein DD-endopeptidase MepM/ murein hydrolase activator NlpD